MLFCGIEDAQDLLAEEGIPVAQAPHTLHAAEESAALAANFKNATVTLQESSSGWKILVLHSFSPAPMATTKTMPFLTYTHATRTSPQGNNPRAHSPRISQPFDVSTWMKTLECWNACRGFTGRHSRLLVQTNEYRLYTIGFLRQTVVIVLGMMMPMPLRMTTERHPLWRKTPPGCCSRDNFAHAPHSLGLGSTG